MPRAQFLIGDGQVTLGQQVIKPNARKVRQLPRLLGLRVHVFGGPSPCSPGVPIEETLVGLPCLLATLNSVNSAC